MNEGFSAIDLTSLFCWLWFHRSKLQVIPLQYWQTHVVQNPVLQIINSDIGLRKML